jgi:hypothetical protein
MKIISKLILLLSTVFIASCGDNPIIGEWVGDSSSHCRVLRFTPNREYCDSMSYEVSYEVSDADVLVKPDQKSAMMPIDLNYTIVSKNVISYMQPFTNKEVLFTRKGTPKVTIEAIKYSKQYTLAELQQSCSSGPAKVTHSSKYWSETVPKQIHKDICLAVELKKSVL